MLRGAALHTYHTAATLQGMEFSLFRLRPGVTDSALKQACQRMATSLYQGQAGFEAHLVMRSDSAPELLADMVLADSTQRARALCGRWGQAPFHPDCRASLGMIVPDSVQLAFWRRVI